MVRFLLFCALCALLQYGGSLSCRAELPAPFVLPNGLRVVMRERHTSPLIAIDLWVQAGAREEGPEEGGSAHFLEHTLFKGTTSRQPGETDIAIENLGATLNAATGPDYAHFYTTVAAAHLDTALALLADIARNATLPNAELERERGVILDELAQNAANPSSALLDALYARAFPTHPYRHPPGGTPAQIRARGRDTLASFYKRTYTPERCTLALVGELTPERAQEAARRAFGDWPGKEKKEGVGCRVSGVGKDSSFILHPSSLRGRVGIAFVAPPANDVTMACAAQVTVALLGESEVGGRLAAGRLIGTEASVRYTPRRDASLFVVSAALPLQGSEAPETAAESEARLQGLEITLRSMVNSLQTAPPSATEIADAKRRLLGRMLFDQETNAGLAWAIGYADITGGLEPEPFRARLKQLTAADLQHFFQRYLAPDQVLSIHLQPDASTGAEGR